MIRVETLGDLFDVALLLTSQPLPPGDRVAVVGNSTALGVLVANACAAEGLRADPARRRRRDSRPAEFARRAARSRATTTTSTPCVVVFVPPLRRGGGRAGGRAPCARSPAGERSRCCRTFLGFEGVPGALAAARHRRAGAAARCRPTRRPSARFGRWPGRVRYAQWRQRPPSTVPELAGVDLDGGPRARRGGAGRPPAGRDLTDEEAGRLLGACRHRRVRRGARRTPSRWC